MTTSSNEGLWGSKIHRSVITLVGPLVLIPKFFLSLPPLPCPNDVIKSTFSNYGLNVIKIGKTNNSNQLIINKCINISLKKTTQAWASGLRDKLI